MSTTFKVRLWSNDHEAAEATDATIRQIGPLDRAELARDAEGKIYFTEQGLAQVLCDGSGRFIRFALLNQGYVREIVDYVNENEKRAQREERV